MTVNAPIKKIRRERTNLGDRAGSAGCVKGSVHVLFNSLAKKRTSQNPVGAYRCAVRRCSGCRGLVRVASVDLRACRQPLSLSRISSKLHLQMSSQDVAAEKDQPSRMREGEGRRKLTTGRSSFRTVRNDPRSARPPTPRNKAYAPPDSCTRAPAHATWRAALEGGKSRSANRGRQMARCRRTHMLDASIRRCASWMRTLRKANDEGTNNAERGRSW